MQTFSEIDFNRAAGTIRPLNGVNLGPNLSKQKIRNQNDSYQALKIPFARLHDAPLDNPGMRLVDIQHIFGNWNADENDPANYYFKQTDDYIRNCLSLGTKIIYRLGTSIEHSLQNYYAFPPSDYDKWITICINIIRHYNEGWADGFSWNIIYWEIWNEPNAKPHMWSGDDKLYYELYGKAAKRIKARFSSLKIGGPSLSCPVQFTAPLKYTHDFLDYCRRENVPLDFYSWHCYPTCLDEIIREPQEKKKILEEHGFPDTELQLNEWHYTPTWEYSARGKARLSDAESAAFTCAVLSFWQDSPLTMSCFYTASYIWGVHDVYGNKQKTYYALLFFARMLDHPQRIFCSAPDDPNTAVLAGVDSAGKAAILVSAWKTQKSEIRLKLKETRAFRITVLDQTQEEPYSVSETNACDIRLTPQSESAVFLLEEL